ncbi:DNA-3-methyladenine glycosylase family protein [Clostridium sp. DL1XJH146]
MDFNYIENIDNVIIIKDVRSFNLKHVFECGQCFRWDKTDEGTYIGVAYDRVIEVEKKDGDIYIYNTNEKDFEEIWVKYFDLYRDYGTIKELLSKDEILKKSVEFGDGIRILNQEPFEIIISFIISANNRIPMIKKVINNISTKWGKPIEYKGHVYYTFPSLLDLKDSTVDDFKSCSAGFRAKYIKSTLLKLKNSVVDIDYMLTLEDNDCFKELQKLDGIGPKVADCIMFFSLDKTTAFPVDVWVKRAMQYFYLAPEISLPKIRQFSIEKFGKLSGFAQQYLFYYARENNIKV